jgi:hypothetical protein
MSCYSTSELRRGFGTRSSYYRTTKSFDADFTESLADVSIKWVAFSEQSHLHAEAHANDQVLTEPPWT